MINNMQRAIVLDHLPELPVGSQVDDPNDVFLLAMALAADADFLVTGDRKAGQLKLQNARRTRILTPTQFCAEAL